jgi:hypothetical protein
MALSREDKADVKGAMGKALANKVSKVTRDSTHDPFTGKQTKILRPKVKMGGSVTRNGVNVDKEIERQTAAKSKALQGKSGLEPSRKLNRAEKKELARYRSQPNPNRIG